MKKEKRLVVLLRHGMTEGNRQKKYIGVTDEPLCEEGVRELLALKEDLWNNLNQRGADLESFARQGTVYVSPLARCRQTAEVLFPEAEQMAVPKLAEMDFGIFENRAFAGDLEHSPEYQKWLDSYCEDPIPQGESRAIFEERCVEGFLAAMEAQKQEALSEPVIFVVHGGTVMSVMHRFAQPAREYYQWNPRNGRGFVGLWDGAAITDIEEM